MEITIILIMALVSLRFYLPPVISGKFSGSPEDPSPGMAERKKAVSVGPSLV